MVSAGVKMSVTGSHQYFKILILVLPPHPGQVLPSTVPTLEEGLPTLSLARAISCLTEGPMTGRALMAEVVNWSRVPFCGDTNCRGSNRRIQHQSSTDYSFWINLRPLGP